MAERDQRLKDAVRAAVQPFLAERFGNPSSIHAAGVPVAQALDHARAAVARLVGAEPFQVHFAPTSAVANQTAILGRARFAEANGLARRFAAGPLQAPAISECLEELSGRGWQVEALAADRLDSKSDACTHVDLAAAFGTFAGLPLALADLHVDSYCFSAAFLHAPLPAAILVLGRAVNIMPVVFGGGQERGLFPGTEPVVSIVAVGKAAEVWLAEAL